MALLGIHLSTQHALKGADTRSATDCRSSRFSLCSNSSLDSTVDSSIESNSECTTEPSIPNNLVLRKFSGHAKTQFVESRLSNVTVTIQREPNKRISITAGAAYHGQHTSMRCAQLNTNRWKFRHVELARAMLKEFVYELYLKLATKPTVHQSWRDELVHESPCEEVLDLKDDAIGASVQNIEWGCGFRWGGDSNYDPQRDGNVILQAGCVLNDLHPAPPVWEARKPTPILTPFEDLEMLRESITACSNSVSIGVIRDKRSNDAYSHPWCIACFECSRVIVKLPIVV